MAVSVHPIEDRQGKHELFFLSDKEVFLLSEECLYPLFGCRIDDYGKTFFVSMPYPSNSGFSYSEDNRQRESLLLCQRLCDTPFFVGKVRKYFLGHKSFSSGRLN